MRDLKDKHEFDMKTQKEYYEERLAEKQRQIDAHAAVIKDQK